MPFLSEADIEQALLEQLQGLGYGVERGGREQRANEVILQDRLQTAVARLNPHVPHEAQQAAVQQVTQTVFPSLLEENRRLHQLMTEGVDVEYHADDGTLTTGKVWLLDFAQPHHNDWLAVNQFTVQHGTQQRRPDVVVFVNGLPLAVIELKALNGIHRAFQQLQTYKQDIPTLFHSNAFLIISDGITARIGSLSANLERFMPWRTMDEQKCPPEMPTLIEGVFEPTRLLALLRNFTVFAQTGAGLTKIIAGYHQFHAVRHAVDRTVAAASEQGNRRAGVIWHTQGSGKSLLMAFYAGQLVKHPAMRNPTLVILTDRNDLDDQLFATFSMCRDLIRQTPMQAESREHLQSLLNRASGGVIFTTLQKFGDIATALTTRHNVVVIADEAHRSQYGFKAKINTKTGAKSYGFAKYIRDALPHASFIGFTGTPIEAEDINTPAVFGDYIDVYDISRAVEDGATVPIYYESRLARIELDEHEKPKIDAEVDALTEDETQDAQERLKQKWANIEALVGSDKRLALVARDLVTHFEQRTTALQGKAMAVCMSRRICIALYNEIIKLRPDWHSDDDHAGAVKIVMTGSASDPQHWQPHIGSPTRRELLAKRARDPNDPLKLVIVRDMWLTGFDAPCMHTMYVDKPMQGHALMQAIARVNRVFRDKPAGLIVDYIGIAQNLKSALRHYSRSDQEKTGIDEAQAVAVMLEKYEIVRDMFYGFDDLAALDSTPQQRLAIMAQAIEWILTKQQQWAAQELTEKDKKKAHRRFQDAVLALSKAFALAAASDEARDIREAVGFFQAIRAALVKSSPTSSQHSPERELAIAQIVSRAVVSTEIVDILSAGGVQSPDISILSDDFLAEVQQMEKKNLALQALRKLLNDGIRARSQANVVQTRAFSERLEDAMARYHANAITTAQVLQELIELAKEIRTARQRGEATGLSEDEMAFYDALAENQSAVDIMGQPQLRLIAHELLTSLRNNISVDWAQRHSARARLRVLVKHILRKYGYPPDLQDAAVQTVLQQAEALSASWTAANT